MPLERGSGPELYVCDMSATDATPTPTLASVALPSEHGGWSLTLEPALLGLLVAPTVAGVALALAALVAFMLRTPLKLSLVDLHRGRRLPRSVLAQRVAATEAVVLVALLAVAATGDPRLWLPLLAALPLLGVELWYDVRSRSRSLIPELAGIIGVGAVAAAIALAGGEPWATSLGLWVIVAARAIAAVPFVRLQIRRIKGQTYRLAGAITAQPGAIMLAAAWLLVEPALLAGTIAIAVLAAFHIVALRMAPPRVAILGAQQVALGLGVVLATAFGVLAP